MANAAPEILIISRSTTNRNETQTATPMLPRSAIYDGTNCDT